MKLLPLLAIVLILVGCKGPTYTQQDIDNVNTSWIVTIDQANESWGQNSKRLQGKIVDLESEVDLQEVKI